MQQKTVNVRASAAAPILNTLIGSMLVLAFSLPGATLARELEVSASASPDGTLRVSFVPRPPVHLSAGFEVRLPDGTLVEPSGMPEPDVPEPFPSYSSSLLLDYPLPSGAHSPEVLSVTYQLCDGEVCHFPETREVPVADSANGASATFGDFVPPDAAKSQTPRQIYSNELNIAAYFDGFASPGRFIRFLEVARGGQTATAGGWRGFLDNPHAFLLAHGWALTVMAILLGGFLLNLTPCVLPMIPVNLAIIGAAASSGMSRRMRFALGLAYGTGMAVAYGGLGAAVVRAGGVFGSGPSSSAAFAGVMAVLLAALGLAMFGTWNLDFSRWRRTSRVAGGARFPAAVLAGGLSALLAGACVAPVLVAVLALAGGLYAEGRSGALLLPFLLGVGMALPWPLAAAGFAVLPKPGAWMERVKKIFGVLILLLAAWYARSAIVRVAGGNASATEDRDAPPGFTVLDFVEPDAPARLESLLARASDEGKPVLLDFGARWCKACSLMETTTLRDTRVTAALEDFLPLSIVADDPSSPSVAPLLARFGVHGYPAYRILSPNPHPYPTPSTPPTDPDGSGSPGI